MSERGRTMYRAGEALSSEELEELIMRRHTDRRAVTTIVAAMAKLVVYWATPYKAFGVLSIEDLIQEGMLGLCEAIEEYRPGGNFHTLVWFNVRCKCSHAIKEARRAVIVKDGRSGVHLPPRELHAAEVEALRRHGSDHAVHVAEVLGTTAARVEDARLRSRKDKSMDAAIPSRFSDGESLTLHGSIAATTESSEEQAMWNELHKHLARACASFRAQLSPRERRIFDARVIAEDEDVVVGHELGKEFGCTRQRIEQIETPLRERFFAHVREMIA